MIKKLTFFLFLVTILLSCSINQKTNAEDINHIYPVKIIHPDSAIFVTFNELNLLLDTAKNILSSKENDALTLEEHRLILMLNFTRRELSGKDTLKVNEGYSAFFSEMNKSNYEDEVCQILDCSICRGMNIYYDPLNLCSGLGITNHFYVMEADCSWKTNY